MNKLWRNRINKTLGLLILSFSLVSAPTLYGNLLAQTAPSKDAKGTKATGTKAADTTPAPSDKEIADAKAKGMVWVNLGSGVYHKEGKFYGKTKRGKFMSEDDAKKAGYREAKTETASKTNSKAAAAGAARGRRIASWPSLKTDLRNAGAEWIDQEVVTDGNLVSSRKPDDIPAFNRAMIDLFSRARGQVRSVA